MTAVPKPQPSDWLKAAAIELKMGDAATLKLLQEAYRDVNSILKDLPDTSAAPLGQLIYRAQMERIKKQLLEKQAALFDKLGDTVKARRLRSASRAAKLSRAADAAYLSYAGQGAEGKRLYDSADITAQRTIETILARAQLSKVTLAERIYNTKVWMNGRLDRLITSTLAHGLNASRFAKVARDWFAPSVPGGTRYAAMRLARTEINNAFHATTLQYAASKPWVADMEWHLSKSHPGKDGCDVIAAASPYPVTEVPRKPHPQCMCYVTEVTPSLEDWTDNFVRGDYDQYLDGELAKADGDVPKETPLTATGASVIRDGLKALSTKALAKKPSLLPKTQHAAMVKFINGMTRDEWSAAGAHINAIDQLLRKKLVVPSGTKTVKIHGQDVQHITYQRVKI